MIITAGLHMAFHRVHSAFLLYTDRYTLRQIFTKQSSFCVTQLIKYVYGRSAVLRQICAQFSSKSFSCKMTEAAVPLVAVRSTT